MATTMVTFSLVGSALLLYRLPQVKFEAIENASQIARKVTDLLENSINSLELQLRPALVLNDQLDHKQMGQLFASIINEQGFQSIYLVSREGYVQVSASATANQLYQNRLIGADLSTTSLFKNALNSTGSIWSDRYLSALKGDLTVAVAIPAGEYVLIAEMTTGRMKDIVLRSLVYVEQQIFVIDGYGEWVADNLQENKFRQDYWGGHQIMRSVRGEIEKPDQVMLHGTKYYPSFYKSKKLGWVIISIIPAGLDNPRFRITIYLVLIGFLASGIIGMIMAPMWASAIERPLKEIMRQSHLISEGNYQTELRGTNILEINELSNDLSRMVSAIAERENSLEQNELYLHQLFNFAPIPMVIAGSKDFNYPMIDMNIELSKLHKMTLEECLGKSGQQLGWKNLEIRSEFMEQLESNGQVNGFEAWMLRKNQSEMLCKISAVKIFKGEEEQVIFSYVDITEMRQMQDILDQMNQDLERLVTNRTLELQKSNDDLAETLRSLNLARDELVRAEKLAALGELVAGIAHELNTPIGNANMTVSTLDGHISDFKQQIELGLKRSTLNTFINDIDTAVDITLRNLTRAADIVSTFKQVAADRASSQRRTFKVYELVEDIRLILHPTMKLVPYQLESDIPDDLFMDSYPGPLSQVLTNLINNAFVHAFDGRNSGVIKITVESIDKDVKFVVSDNGAGIPLDFQSRVFDPFFTTRLGSGGTGLGLHISHNIITNVLGGRIELVSYPGKGTEFTIFLPQTAPIGD